MSEEEHVSTITLFDICFTIIAIGFSLSLFFLHEKTFEDSNTVAIITSNSYVPGYWYSYNRKYWDQSCQCNRKTSESVYVHPTYDLTMMVYSNIFCGEKTISFPAEDNFGNDRVFLKEFQPGDTVNYLAYLQIHRFSGDTLETGVRRRNRYLPWKTIEKVHTKNPSLP